jgi:hypothetical protein
MKRFFSSSKLPDRLVSHQVSTRIVPGYFPRNKWPEREADHSTTSSVEVKKD